MIKIKKSIHKKNKKYLFQDIKRNSSLAIRKRYYKEILPTSIQTIRNTPLYLLPVIIPKLLVKLIFSICIDAPLKKAIIRK